MKESESPTTPVARRCPAAASRSTPSCHSVARVLAPSFARYAAGSAVIHSRLSTPPAPEASDDARENQAIRATEARRRVQEAVRSRAHGSRPAARIRRRSLATPGLLHARAAPCQLRQRASGAAPRRHALEDPDCRRGLAIPDGLAGVSVHRRLSHGAAHARLHGPDPARPGTGRSRSRRRVAPRDFRSSSTTANDAGPRPSERRTCSRRYPRNWLDTCRSTGIFCWT